MRWLPDKCSRPNLGDITYPASLPTSAKLVAIAVIDCISLRYHIEIGTQTVILAVGNTKGGVGKTTIAVNLAILRATSRPGRATGRR